MKDKGEYIFRAHPGAHINAGVVRSMSPSGRFAFLETMDNEEIVVEVAKAEVLEDVTPAPKSVPQAQQPPLSLLTDAEKQAAQQQQQ